ncbi:MAG: hypothetical protein J0L70_03070 [Leptolyngbya sp. UWPOB_LEPTO1]|uniref:hypothetical protein n=1 Tax=Leptolyngbya sp. UWPOB_LEPTO1 TaxID=2815653 RepID=UPI001AD2DF7A|nr:hypothetical protein [Leptolyngbya sp. UWPOB_LEPTO1]MBN8559484.1 hypothetical protein [Leptolyngbya sp. UWPOB_LEPTO1]
MELTFEEAIRVTRLDVEAGVNLIEDDYVTALDVYASQHPEDNHRVMKAYQELITRLVAA